MIKESQSHSAQRRILCIDGGGILGTFPAAFLAGLEQHLPKPIGEYFDLIAGTSTGGIIAIGLAMGLRAQELLDLYEDRGPTIFGQDSGKVRNCIRGKLRFARRLFVNKYSAERLQIELKAVLGEKRIGDASARLLVPAWNPLAHSVYLYKTAHHPRLQNDYKCLAVDAAMATAAAPTYFPRHVTEESMGLTDGGTWANNPIALAVVEAISVLEWPANSLRVLSLGCLEETYNLPKKAGIGTLGTKVIKLFMEGQSRGALGIAKLLTSHEHEREAIYRINHSVPVDTFKLDDTGVIQELKGLGVSLARDRQPILEPIFFRTPAEEFVPNHALETFDDVTTKRIH